MPLGNCYLGNFVFLDLLADIKIRREEKKERKKEDS
jgi:hypothetical protein